MIYSKESLNLFGDVHVEAPNVDRDNLANILFVILQDVPIRNFVGYITNQYEEVFEYINLCKGKNTCQKTSLLFNPHRLDTRAKDSNKSLFTALSDMSFISGLARATLFKEGRVKELLYQVLQLGINGVQYVNEFPPHVARDIAYKCGINSSSKVLDPCGGWGGRMIGISVVANHYITYEPSSKSYLGLCELAEFIKLLKPEFCPQVNQLCFEDTDLPSNEFDMAITSPPYYDTELYSDESTNSLNRYKTFDDWVAGFYIPMITKTLSALKPGCTFAIAIGSRKYPLNTILMDVFSGECDIEKQYGYLSGVAGLDKKGEGETIYFIRKV